MEGKQIAVAATDPPRRRWALPFPPESPALICTFADYLGLSILTPSLPFFLADLGVADVELWVGAVLSAQYVAIVLGNPAWGAVADRFGVYRALFWSMVGDTVFFAATAAARTPAALIGIRFCAGGCSPLVPALALIFKVMPAQRVPVGIGRYSLAICGGYAVGAAAVGALYAAVGFAGSQLITGGAAAAAAIFTGLDPGFRKGSAGDARPQVSGVSAALRTAHFAVYATTQFAIGWSMNAAFAVLVVSLSGEFGWTVEQVGFSFLVVAGVLMVQFIWTVPTAVNLLGVERVLAISLLGLLVPAAVLATPLRIAAGGVGFVGIIVVHFIFMTAAQLAATSRARTIGARYTENGTGAVTGVGRTFFALGQALSPAASLGAYSRLGPGSPWIIHDAVIAAVIVLHVALGIWPKELREAPPPTPAVADVKAQHHQESAGGLSPAALEIGGRAAGKK